MSSENATGERAGRNVPGLRFKGRARTAASEARPASAMCRRRSNAIKLDVLPGVHRTLEPLGHIADAVPRSAARVSEYRRPGIRRMRYQGQLRHRPLCLGCAMSPVGLGEGGRRRILRRRFGQCFGQRSFRNAELSHSAAQIRNDAVSLSFVHGFPDSAFWFSEDEPKPRADRGGSMTWIYVFYEAWRSAWHASISVLPHAY